MGEGTAGEALEPRLGAVRLRKTGGRGAGTERGYCGGTPLGKGGSLFKQQVPGCPARPAWASEHTGLQGRVAPKTLED